MECERRSSKAPPPPSPSSKAPTPRLPPLHPPTPLTTPTRTASIVPTTALVLLARRRLVRGLLPGLAHGLVCRLDPLDELKQPLPVLGVLDAQRRVLIELQVEKLVGRIDGPVAKRGNSIADFGAIGGIGGGAGRGVWGGVGGGGIGGQLAQWRRRPTSNARLGPVAGRGRFRCSLPEGCVHRYAGATISTTALTSDPAEPIVHHFSVGTLLARHRWSIARRGVLGLI